MHRTVSRYARLYRKLYLRRAKEAQYIYLYSIRPRYVQLLGGVDRSNSPFENHVEILVKFCYPEQRSLVL